MASGRGNVELKIPADGAYIVVAKRAASALGSAAGFSLEGIDDLNIAVAQACEKAILAGQRLWGQGGAVVKLGFRVVEGGMEVDVRTMPARDAGADEARLRREVEEARRVNAALSDQARRLSQEVAEERAERIRAQEQAGRLTGRRAPSGRTPAGPTEDELDVDQLAVNMIRLFVDELRYNVDSHGSMRMRMVKYLVD